MKRAVKTRRLIAPQRQQEVGKTRARENGKARCNPAEPRKTEVLGRPTILGNHLQCTASKLHFPDSSFFDNLYPAIGP